MDDNCNKMEVKEEEDIEGKRRIARYKGRMDEAEKKEMEKNESVKNNKENRGEEGDYRVGRGDHCI